MNITKRFCDKFEANKEERLNDEKTGVNNLVRLFFNVTRNADSRK